MKKGCLLLLAVWVAVAAGYAALLRNTELFSLWWIPILFSLAAAMIVGNIQGIFLAIKQKRASGRSPLEWRDGDYVAVSGRISAARGPITAPFSGIPACIIEYEIKGAGGGPAGDYLGFLMTPSVINSQQGAVRLVGFPLLTELPKATYTDADSCARAGSYLSQCTFKEKAGSPFAIISQLSSVLKDDDGTVSENFCAKNATIHLPDDSQAAEAAVPLPDLITSRLRDGDLYLEETLVKNGDEVTAFGTYRQAKQAVDIGSGLQNVTHSLKPGTVSDASGKMLRQSVITILIIGAIFAGGNYFLFKALGIPLNADTIRTLINLQPS